MILLQRSLREKHLRLVQEEKETFNERIKVPDLVTLQHFIHNQWKQAQQQNGNEETESNKADFKKHLNETLKEKLDFNFSKQQKLDQEFHQNQQQMREEVKTLPTG